VSARRLLVTLAAIALAHPAPAPAQQDCISCTYSVSVTPLDTTIAFAQSAGNQTIHFTVKNTGTGADTYTFTCSATGGESCVSVSPTSGALDIGASDTVTVTYSVGSTSGNVVLTAASSHAQASGTLHVLISPTVTLVVPTLTSGSRAVVHNRQPIIRALLQPNGTAVDSTRTTFTWRGSSVLTLARANHGLVEWEVDSTHWLAVGDSAQIVVTACAQAGNCTTVSRWAVLPFDSTAVLGFQGIPFEALGRAFGAPFGPGLAVSGAEVETAIGTVPYFSMGAARSVGLVYSTRQSYPRALVPVDLELTWPTGAPDQVKLILSDGGTKLDSLVVATPSCSSWNSSVRRCRAVLQGDFSGSTFSTPTRKWLTIEARVTSGATTKVSTDSVEVVLVDRRTTPYGSGWWPSRVLKLVAAGSDRVLVGSSGTAGVYRGIGDSVYISPPGDFSVLKKVGSTWELSPRGSPAKLVFDASGRLVKGLDANSNKDSIVYNGATDQVTSFIDPMGKTITVAYDGNGKISTFTDPGSRQTTVSVNGSTYQLTYDSISSLTTRPYTSTFVYQTYPGTGTVVLTKRVGVIKDTTEAVYDSTFRRRPVQAKLPRVPNEVGDSSALPTVSYTAVQQRGFGAFVSLESTYVTVTDPRADWTRSLLNRWGQARKTWDALDSMGRAEYSPEGFVLWRRGKTGDSSRVNSVYDAQGLGHLVATYMKRSATDSLRLDSLVYDANHRVTQRIDALGHVSQAAYDANGNVTSATTPSGDVTQYWYLSDGLVDSTRAPGDTVSQRFFYDGTWGSLSSVVDQGGTTIVQHSFDSYGRGTAAQNKIFVRVHGDTTFWRWRERETFFNVSNGVDSSRIRRTDECWEITTDPGRCDLPNWPPSPDTDTIRVQRVRFVADRAGRDSLRIDDRGDTTQYVNDRLGRTIRRRPWIDSSAVRDSFAYDLAGNLRRTFTRRGDLIAAGFDSRNRMTDDTIPGVGILQPTYGGPLDQVTRQAYANVVDSIGGVTATLAWVYDKSGRLKADTSFTGAQARVTSYTYDTYERPSTSTDALGAWTTRYDATRGLVDTLLTPMNDTVSYLFDGQWRVRSRGINGGGAPHTLTPRYGLPGVVTSVIQTVGTSPTFTTMKYDRHLFADTAGPALLPVVTGQNGSSAGLDSLPDSITYDGWGRVTAVVSYKNGVLAARDTFAFDRLGNIKTTAGGEVYDPRTTRLTAHAGSGCTPWSYTYDRAGNLTQSNCGSTTWTYQYDALNQLRSVRLGNTLIARYGYDASGRRIAKRVYSNATGGTVAYTRFVYHGGNVAFETDSGGTIGLRYTWTGTDALLAVDNGTNHYYAVNDKVGSVRGLVRRDGTWVMSQRFGPYGAVIARDTNASASPGFALRYGWTGREYDPETGFYFLRSRYYDLTVRRFLQEDPAGYAGSSNLYAYVDGDVTEARDPSGMLAEHTAGGDPFFFQVCFTYPCVGPYGPIVSGDGGGGFSGDLTELEIEALISETTPTETGPKGSQVLVDSNNGCGLGCVITRVVNGLVDLFFGSSGLPKGKVVANGHGYFIATPNGGAGDEWGDLYLYGVHIGTFHTSIIGVGVQGNLNLSVWTISPSLAAFSGNSEGPCGSFLFVGGCSTSNANGRSWSGGFGFGGGASYVWQTTTVTLDPEWR
jgi:RHS repeat-associated protein